MRVINFRIIIIITIANNVCIVIRFLGDCVSEKTSTHIIGYKLRNSCLILIIFYTKIPHII